MIAFQLKPVDNGRVGLLTTGVIATAVLVLLTCCIYLRSRQRSAHARQLDFEAARNNKLSDLEAGGTTPRAGDSSGSSPLDSARAKPPPLPPKTPTTPRRGDLRAAVDSRKALAAESRELRRDIATTPRGTAAAAPAAEEPAGARTDIPEELRQRIDAMRRELRSDKAASRSRRNSKRTSTMLARAVLRARRYRPRRRLLQTHGGRLVRN